MAKKIPKKTNKKPGQGTNLAASIEALDSLGNSPWFKPESGRNVIRILPAYHREGPNAGLFFYRVMLHKGIQVEGRNATIPCAKNNGPGAFCAVCEFKAELEGSSNKKNSDLGKKIRPQDSYFINLVDRKDDKVKKYGMKRSMMKSLKSYLLDPDYGDITDPESGMDIVIEKEGENLDTRYTVKVRPKNTAIEHDNWEDEMFDIFKPGEVMDAIDEREIYNIMKKAFGRAFSDLVDPDFTSNKEDEYEEDEDEDEDVVDLDEMNRSELKAFIKERKLNVTVKKSDSDDDIREHIEDAISDGNEDEDEY